MNTPSASDRAVIALHARERALQKSRANQKLWSLITECRELRERIRATLAVIEPNEAEHVLSSEGLDVPKGATNFGALTFCCAIEKLGEIEEALTEGIGLATCDLPPPPAIRRAA